MTREEVESCIDALKAEISEFDTGIGAQWVTDSEALIEKLEGQINSSPKE